ncbi:alpha-galactosidase [Aspergillus mulundensis]|uniref:Alpha-galactosidase n=1 Tax=Aspergillus mulundensis TaxID=1810919 RepID=A0A3D8QS74_9EURO|nr:putative alpha-galactosidase G [Aspergillus mulundensis]RDW64541.1 putative alpha-galactosidase G [Aspergillus mulundensis]
MPEQEPVVVTDSSFALNGRTCSYTFHVDVPTGDLRSDHFGARIRGPIPVDPEPIVDGWTGMPDRVRREFPDQGRGDFRVPACRITQGAGHTVSAFKFRGCEVVRGKPEGDGLPGTFGTADDATTLIVRLDDEVSCLEAELRYTVFPAYDAIVRSARIVNKSAGHVAVEQLASLCVDFPYEHGGLEMVSLRGDWAREAHRLRRRVEYGVQSIGSTTGFSSHLHNPFVALVHPSTTESHGDAWGFSLVYSGSFTMAVEKASQGLTRVVAGPNTLGWTLKPGESISSPECVAVYSAHGIGGMSRSLHGLYRKHLMKSSFATRDRPVLLNSWEGMYFDIDQGRMVRLAEEAAALGVKLLVMDDGWFGEKYPRTSDDAGLGDWVPNPVRFPDGLEPLVDKITALKVAGSSSTLRFGIWVEPEMVNPQSTLYEQHPDWVLHAGSYPRTQQRNQLVLNLGLECVQEFIIDAITTLLSTANGAITYVKWDHNRGLAETPAPSANYAYILGMYRVFDVLTTRFPDVLWEGCASGGGRYDPGILQYFPQVWASDDSDAVERIFIQFGSSLVYPPSSMGGHISSVPNHQTGRSTPLTFRAHVAMMCGSFGLELNPSDLSLSEREAIPGLIALAEKVNPIVLQGDMWRLNLPEESNWPAALFISESRGSAVLFVFQLAPWVNHALPRVRLQGLDGKAMYRVDGEGPYAGSMLMNLGVQYSFRGDYGSRVVFLERVSA